MAANTLATLRILLGLDATDVEKGSDRAKKAVGGFQTGAKVAFGIAGVAAAAGFGLMVKGSQEMERAQGNFQAETGRSREEAVAFTKDMNGLVGTAATVGKSFEEIADTGTTVAAQFGVVGEENRKLTENILAYSKVVRTDGVTATNELDDTLSAFNLTSEDAGPLLDKLVAGHHRFGTEAGPESLGVLRQMAPALSAMGLGLDDGLELLNAFEVGLGDSAAAGGALDRAIKNLKPGEDLNDLIARLGAIEDPLKRAQEATKIFGRSAGPDLAKLIKPGMTSLDEFGVSAEEAAGAVGRGAEDMVTWGDKIKMFAEKAGAALRGLGQDIGPLAAGLGGVASLAAPFSGQLKSLFDGLAKSGPIRVAAAAVGTVTGAAQAAAHQVAATGASVVSGLATRIAGMAIPLAPAGTTVGVAVGGAMSAGMIAGLASLGIAAFFSGPIIEKLTGTDPSSRMYNAGVQLADKFMAGQSDQIKAQYAQTFFDATNQALEQRSLWDKLWNNGIQSAVEQGKAAADTYAASVGVQMPTAASHQQPATAAAWAALGTTSGTAMARGTVDGFDAVDPTVSIRDDFVETWHERNDPAFIALGGGVPGQIGQAMADRSRDVLTGAETLRNILENGLTPREQAIEVIGKDYARLLSDGMTSGIPGAKETAQQLAIQAIKTIEQAGLTGAEGQQGVKAIGQYYDLLLANGMTANQAKAALAAGGVSEAVVNALGNPQAVQNAVGQGKNIANAWLTGLQNRLQSDAAAGIIGQAASIAAREMRGQSPPKTGPLRFIDKWGENIGQAWVKGLSKGASSASDVLARLSPMNGLTLQPAFALAGASEGLDRLPPVNVNAYAWRPDDLTRQIEKAQRRSILRARLTGAGRE